MLDRIHEFTDDQEYAIEEWCRDEEFAATEPYRTPSPPLPPNTVRRPMGPAKLEISKRTAARLLTTGESA